MKLYMPRWCKGMCVFVSITRCMGRAMLLATPSSRLRNTVNSKARICPVRHAHILTPHTPGQERIPCSSLSLLHLGICLLHSPCTPVPHLQHICTNGIETKFGRETSVSIRRIQTYSAASCYSGGMAYSHCRFHADRRSTRPRPRG